MRRNLTRGRRYGSGRTVIVSIHVTRDLRELVDLSAGHNGLSRSAEINRLLLLALGQTPSHAGSETHEVRGHVL